MPVTFVVRSPGATPAAAAEEAAKLAFDAPRVVLGRSASCDVRLPDASVSGRHASVRAASAGYVVVDEGSTNGTRLNGEQLAPQAPRALKTGDLLLLGRVELEVRLGAAKPSSAADTRDLALVLARRMLGEASAGSCASVAVIEGPDAGASLALEAPGARTIGRDPRCALRLTDRSIPPVALEVIAEATRVLVLARDARAAAMLGEHALDRPEPTPWTDGVVLSLGATRLRLDDPVARALDASASVEDEKVQPTREPEPTAEPQEQPPAPVSAEPQPAPRPEPRGADRRRSWRGATLALELVALIVGLLVLAASAAGLWWLLRK